MVCGMYKHCVFLHLLRQKWQTLHPPHNTECYQCFVYLSPVVWMQQTWGCRGDPWSCPAALQTSHPTAGPSDRQQQSPDDTRQQDLSCKKRSFKFKNKNGEWGNTGGWSRSFSAYVNIGTWNRHLKDIAKLRGLMIWNELYLLSETPPVPRLRQRRHSHEPAILQTCTHTISHKYLLELDRAFVKIKKPTF